MVNDHAMVGRGGGNYTEVCLMLMFGEDVL